MGEESIKEHLLRVFCSPPRWTAAKGTKRAGSCPCEAAYYHLWKDIEIGRGFPLREKGKWCTHLQRGQEGQCRELQTAGLWGSRGANILEVVSEYTMKGTVVTGKSQQGFSRVNHARPTWLPPVMNYLHLWMRGKQRLLSALSLARLLVQYCTESSHPLLSVAAWMGKILTRVLFKWAHTLEAGYKLNSLGVCPLWYLYQWPGVRDRMQYYQAVGWWY